jgi:DNA-binding beta-propeller fold protein YncE
MKVKSSMVVRWISPLLIVVSTTVTPELSEATDALPGERVWIARYDGPSHRSDSPAEVAVSPDGSTVFVTGDSYRPGCSNWATVAYDASDGEQLWSARYDGAEHWCDNVAGIAVSDDGKRVYVTGQVQESDAGDITTIAYDAVGGSELWVASENAGLDGGADTAAGVATHGANVYVVGTVNTRCDNSIDRCYYEVVVASYDGQTGQRRWIDEYESAATTSSYVGAFGSGITVGAGDSVYVSAETAGGNVETLAYDGASGSRRWVVHSKDDYYANAVETSPDGGTVYVAAFSARLKASVTAYAASDGSELWRVERGSASFGYPPYIAVDPAGDEVFLAAESREDYLAMSIDADTGSIVWRALYDAAGRLGDSPAGIVVSADGEEVVVTGSAGRPGNWGSTYGTVAFDGANGEKLWVQKYGFGRLGNYHYATAIAAAPQGGVYITGESEGPTGWGDYATIRYG